MNEAVALELLGLAGLATQEAIATSFVINGGDSELRLAIEHPDDVWEDANFDAEEAVLYKADSEGDYSYRGEDEEAYADVLGVKAGDDDYEPLIDFLDFINNSDDATFAAELDSWLDIDSFATYLALQDLIGNSDDIDGRGNNSYLHYDAGTEKFTVVAWDHNLAFNTANVTGGPGGGQGAGQRPPAAPDDGGQERGGPGAGGSNVLASRFSADETFAAMVASATAELIDSMYASDAAAGVLERWVDVLTSQATELVDTATIEAEAAAISAEFPAGS